MSKRCKACCRLFRPHPQVPNQTYCSAPECQRERRRRWQQLKRREDPHYRENDADHHKAWAAANTGYWKHYRDSHPDYADHNRSLQQDRNRRQAETGIANEDEWIVEITVISSCCDDSGG